MATKPGTAAAMRAYWDDPNWRARQLGLIAAARQSKSPSKTQNLVQTTVGLDPVTYQILRTLAIERLTSVPEIIRTYIQWGLDTDGVTNDE